MRTYRHTAHRRRRSLASPYLFYVLRCIAMGELGNLCAVDFTRTSRGLPGIRQLAA
jgi:hypothetical protein